MTVTPGVRKDVLAGTGSCYQLEAYATKVEQTGYVQNELAMSGWVGVKHGNFV